MCSSSTTSWPTAARSRVRDAGATLVGAGICVEKAFQPGGDLIRSMGVRVESLARVKSMDEATNSIEFCE